MNTNATTIPLPIPPSTTLEPLRHNRGRRARPIEDPTVTPALIPVNDLLRTLPVKITHIPRRLKYGTTAYYRTILQNMRDRVFARDEVAALVNTLTTTQNAHPQARRRLLKQCRKQLASTYTQAFRRLMYHLVSVLAESGFTPHATPTSSYSIRHKFVGPAPRRTEAILMQALRSLPPSRSRRVFQEYEDYLATLKYYSEIDPPPIVPNVNADLIGKYREGKDVGGYYASKAHPTRLASTHPAGFKKPQPVVLPPHPKAVSLEEFHRKANQGLYRIPGAAPTAKRSIKAREKLLDEYPEIVTIHGAQPWPPTHLNARRPGRPRTNFDSPEVKAQKKREARKAQRQKQKQEQKVQFGPIPGLEDFVDHGTHDTTDYVETQY